MCHVTLSGLWYPPPPSGLTRVKWFKATTKSEQLQTFPCQHSWTINIASFTESSRLMSLLLSQIYCLTLFLLGYMYTKILLCYFSEAHVERDLESMVREPLTLWVPTTYIYVFCVTPLGGQPRIYTWEASAVFFHLKNARGKLGSYEKFFVSF